MVEAPKKVKERGAIRLPTLRNRHTAANSGTQIKQPNYLMSFQ